MKKSSILFFLLLSTIIFAQKSVKIKGQIIVVDAKPSEVYVANLTTKEEVVSDEKGFFEISVNENDLLIFSAKHLDYMRKIVEGTDVEKGLIKVEMTSKNTFLDEVEVINYSRLNAVSLGILDKPAKVYTPAERKLYAATSTPFDALLNLISGRTANLEENVLTEKKEFSLASLDGLYPEQFYTETLKIPIEKIGAFHYFIVEDASLEAALKGKNVFLVRFLMIKLASDFNAIQDVK